MGCRLHGGGFWPAAQPRNVGGALQLPRLQQAGACTNAGRPLSSADGTLPPVSAKPCCLHLLICHPNIGPQQEMGFMLFSYKELRGRGPFSAWKHISQNACPDRQRPDHRMGTDPRQLSSHILPLHGGRCRANSQASSYVCCVTSMHLSPLRSHISWL